MLINEVQFVHFVFELFQPEQDRSDENSWPWVLSVMERETHHFFLLQLLLGHLHFIDEQIHHFNWFLFYANLNRVSLRQVVKSLQHINSLLYCCHLFERVVNHILIHYIQLFDSSLKAIVFIMPVRGFHIQDFLFFAGSKFVNQFPKGSFYFQKDSNNFRSFCPTEFWNLSIFPFEGKLKLPLTNFNQLRASLNERFNWGEDRIGREFPFSLGCFVNNFNVSIINLSPSFSTFDGIIEISDAFLDISIQHIWDIDLGFASLNNFVGDFMKQPGNSFTWVIVLGVVPDHSDSH